VIFSLLNLFLNKLDPQKKLNATIQKNKIIVGVLNQNKRRKKTYSKHVETLVVLKNKGVTVTLLVLV